LKAICLASVVPQLTARVIQASREYLEKDPFVVDVGVKTGIKVRYEDPKAVGADRIADAVAVMYLYGGPACIIDFGTATTFNALTRDGEYLGGAITAGVNLATEALFTHAAKLPRIDLQRPPSVIGRNTVHAMQAGLLFGYVSMVEGMVERFRRELGPQMKVVATGGLAEIVAQETDVIQIIAPWLTLDGLRILWDLNHPL
jgi:type III pantothenate kinase